jgi:hypothetical protein
MSCKGKEISEREVKAVAQSLASLPPPPPPVASAPPAPALSAMFQKGLTDRTAWEQWFTSLSGVYQGGADYWTAQRSLAHPGPCEGSPEFVAGCTAAKTRLTPSDVLRKSEPDYKLGWNAYGH